MNSARTEVHKEAFSQ